MSLERKDVRFKLDHDVHAALKAIAEQDGVDMGEWIEALLKPAVDKRVRDAIELADRLQRVGITGSGRESGGK
jgi:hypothetical protein